MYKIANINYLKILEMTKKQGVKVVILFLFEKSGSFPSYECNLASKFNELDSHSGENITFITHYSNDALGVPRNGYLNEHLLRMRENRDKYKKMFLPDSVDAEDRDAYLNMRLVAKAFDCGMENRLPCFVIFNPQAPKEFVEVSINGLDDVFVQASLIITFIQEANYDISVFAQKYKGRTYTLSADDVLEETIRTIKQGIDARVFWDAVKAENFTDSFDKTVLERLSKTFRKRIPIERFLNNYDRIKIGEFKEGKLSKIIDEYISLFTCDDEMFFPEIADFIESSSADFLRVAKYYDKKINQDKEKEKEPRSAYYSVIAICLGKVIEDEMNLGFFNACREAYGITLPKYYNIVQRESPTSGFSYNNIKGKFRIYNYYDQTIENRTLNFNNEQAPSSSALKYLQISQLRAIVFDNETTARTDADTIKMTNAKNRIASVKSSITDCEWDDGLLNDLRIVAENRNNAVHKVKGVNEVSCKSSLDSFKRIVEKKFFEVNNELKRIGYDS